MLLGKSEEGRKERMVLDKEEWNIGFSDSQRKGVALIIGVIAGGLYFYFVLVKQPTALRYFFDQPLWLFVLFYSSVPLIAGIASFPLRLIRWGLVSFCLTSMMALVLISILL